MPDEVMSSAVKLVKVRNGERSLVPEALILTFSSDVISPIGERSSVMLLSKLSMVKLTSETKGEISLGFMSPSFIQRHFSMVGGEKGVKRHRGNVAATHAARRTHLLVR